MRALSKRHIKTDNSIRNYSQANIFYSTERAFRVIENNISRNNIESIGQSEMERIDLLRLSKHSSNNKIATILASY